MYSGHFCTCGIRQIIIIILMFSVNGLLVNKLLVL